MANENETIKDIATEFRELAKNSSDGIIAVKGEVIADRIDAALKRDAEKIERIVRDAVVDYNGMYTCAPNDEAEREVVERAEIANEWLKAHGMEPEPFYYSKEETPCL